MYSIKLRFVSLSPPVLDALSSAAVYKPLLLSRHHHHRCCCYYYYCYWRENKLLDATSTWRSTAARASAPLLQVCARRVLCTLGGRLSRLARCTLERHRFSASSAWPSRRLSGRLSRTGWLVRASSCHHDLHHCWCVDWLGRRCPHSSRNTATLCCDKSSAIVPSCATCRATVDGYRCCPRWSDCVTCCIYNSTATRMPAETRFEACRSMCRRNGRTEKLRSPHCIDDQSRMPEIAMPPPANVTRRASFTAAPTPTSKVYILVQVPAAAAAAAAAAAENLLPPRTSDDTLRTRADARYVEF